MNGPNIGAPTLLMFYTFVSTTNAYLLQYVVYIKKRPSNILNNTIIVNHLSRSVYYILDSIYHCLQTVSETFM